MNIFKRQAFYIVMYIVLLSFSLYVFSENVYIYRIFSNLMIFFEVLFYAYIVISISIWTLTLKKSYLAFIAKAIIVLLPIVYIVISFISVTYQHRLNFDAHLNSPVINLCLLIFVYILNIILLFFEYKFRFKTVGIISGINEKDKLNISKKNVILSIVYAFVFTMNIVNCFREAIIFNLGAFCFFLTISIVLTIFNNKYIFIFKVFLFFCFSLLIFGFSFEYYFISAEYGTTFYTLKMYYILLSIVVLCLFYEYTFKFSSVKKIRD